MADPFPTPRRTRVLRIVLALSLALNLAVAGLALGVVLRGKDGHPPRNFDMSLGPVARALSPEDRRAIRDTLKDRHDLAPRRGRGAELQGLVAALSAEPYASEAVREALEVPARRAAQVQQSAIDALVARVDAMSPEDRAALAARLSQDGGR